MHAEITRDDRTFVARVTFDSGAVWSFTDGGVSRSLESFLPKAQAWLQEIGCGDSVPKMPAAAEAAE